MRLSLTRTLALTAVAGLALTACGSDAGGGDDSYKIGISQYVTHPALDSAREGFKEAFEDAGIDVDWDEQNAQADQGTVNNISGNFNQDSDMDLVLAIATPSAITAATTVQDKPVLFAAVTDPVDAKLVQSWDEPGGNVTGVSDMNPVKEQLELIQRITPDVKTIGIVYSSAESNSVVQLDAAKKAAEELGLEIKESAITNTSEVQQGVQSLGDVDAIYVPTDNTVVSGLESVIGYGEDRQIPVYAAESDSVERGAIATYGLNYRAHGKQAGEMAIKVLKDGKKPADLPVETAPSDELVITVNEDAAKAMGVEIPQDVLDEAQQSEKSE